MRLRIGLVLTVLFLIGCLGAAGGSGEPVSEALADPVAAGTADATSSEAAAPELGPVLLALTQNGQSLRIFHIDVEQGDATLFVSPSGNTLLVDSGKNGHGSRIKAVMDLAGVSQIDHFVNTHYHEDHYVGIEIAKLVSAGRLVGLSSLSGGLPDTRCICATRSRAEKNSRRPAAYSSRASKLKRRAGCCFSTQLLR